MIAPSRSLLRFLRCAARHHVPACRLRAFATTGTASSGHSRWSTIKHDKAKADAKKNKNRSMLAEQIELVTKLYGPDVDANPRLKNLVADAKKQGFPKEGVETAIKRGQGLSTTGKPLESVTIDAVFPSGVAAIIECQTESKLRTLMAVRYILTKHAAQSSPTQYLFKRRGSIILKPLPEDITSDSVMEIALEIEGFEDMVEEEDGVVELVTEPNATKAVANAVVDALGVNIENLDIVWQPNDYINVVKEEQENLFSAVDKIQDLTEVREVYLNVHRGDTAEAYL